MESKDVNRLKEDLIQVESKFTNQQALEKIREFKSQFPSLEKCGYIVTFDKIRNAFILIPPDKNV